MALLHAVPGRPGVYAYRVRSGDVFEMILRRNLAGGHEVDVLAEDRGVELLQALARVDPQLVDERAATLLEGIECLRLPA